MSHIFTWIIVYASISRGINSSGKVVYFTALFPYLVFTIFFVRVLMLKGAGAGLVHMFYPRIESLINPTAWMETANQVFSQFGLALGAQISFGRYNPPNKNIVKDVWVLSLTNFLTAIYACAIIFASLGFKAQDLFDTCIEQ